MIYEKATCSELKSSIMNSLRVLKMLPFHEYILYYSTEIKQCISNHRPAKDNKESVVCFSLERSLFLECGNIITWSLRKGHRVPRYEFLSK